MGEEDNNHGFIPVLFADDPGMNVREMFEAVALPGDVRRRACAYQRKPRRMRNPDYAN